MSLVLAPFLLQGILIAVDEFLHHKRDLGTWERLGHPLDTLSVFLVFLYISLNPYSEERFPIFLGLSIFSCLLVTKDEFIHQTECSGFESWLHALLFILHPLIFVSGGLIWMRGSDSISLGIFPWISGSYLIYQICRWSIPWKKFKS